MTRAKVPLKTWQPLRVWRNRTNADQKRTINVYPCVEQFPPGCVITVFEAPEAETGGSQTGRVDVGPRGDSVALTIQPGNAVFVQFDQGKSSTASVLADIAQEP